tara:strand:+ start:207 stop:395 length:189 start_codon:yes stop_codon:yes gene_type:complete
MPFDRSVILLLLPVTGHIKWRSPDPPPPVSAIFFALSSGSGALRRNGAGFLINFEAEVLSFA